ncbi:MAG TPA: hypothetical protein VEW48_19915 [Thermoanaerobaculia bacterium]|nr:hypothetical protein [Thermoanaerobaculia bacterium]
MADIDKRLRYYNGQFLQEQDFTAEQDYHLDRLRRHNRQLHTYGIAEGLTVTAAVGATSAVVSTGTALDGEGRMIVLTESRTLSFSLTNQWVLVVISYRQQTSDPATVGDSGDTRWLERPDVEVIAEAGAPAADVRIRLARLQIAANGTVSQADMTVRTSAGVRLGTEVSIERIRLSRQGVASNLWPVLSSGAASQADVTGNLAVSGNIILTGTNTVDGRDVSVDGANLDTHRARTDNPHSVTAAQVQAITGVGGVTNPGGVVNLLAGTNIAITPDNTGNKRITIAGSSIAGVSNPGGDIAVNGTGGISVVGNDAANTITIGTSPAAIGALASGDYLKSYITTVWFNQDHAEGASTPVNIGFQPKFIWVSGRTHGFLYGGTYGATLNGFCKVNSTSSWERYGWGPYVYRFSTAPYWSSYGTIFYNSILGVMYYDSSASPNLYASLQLDISAVTATGFTVVFHRYHGSNTSPGFFIEAHFACFG